MGVSLIISLLGGISLFLFGMSLMGEGLKKVAGNKLEIILWKLTGNPIKGVLLGTAVTAVIQSSSATTVMTVGFVNSGMMTVTQAIGIIMGANIGTSITGWILCLSNISGGSSGWIQLLSTSSLTAIIALVGIVFRMFAKSDAKKHIGDIMLGFAVLMFGMQAMSAAVSPLKESEAFTGLLTMFSNPILGILVGIIITAVLQSNSASIGILQALSITGMITFSNAFPIIMGMGIGAATPVLLSAIGANKNGKRTALIYLCNDLFGTLIWSTLFYTLNAFLHFSFLNSVVGPVAIALINSLFRIATMLVLVPFIKCIEKFVCFIVRDNPNEENETADIEKLEERFIDHPALAIEQSKNAICSMSEKAKSNLSRAMLLLDEFDESDYRKVQEKEDIIDKYEDRLGTYLVKLTGKELGKQQSREVSKFLHTIGDFERIGDHAVNISDVAKELHEKSLEFSFEARHELSVLANAVSEIVEISVAAFAAEDKNLALRVEPLEEMIDILCDEIKLRHIDRVQNGNCTLNQGFVFNDLLTNYERIADHCSNIAVAMIELESDCFDTHEYLGSLKKLKSGSFNNFFEEYKVKYAI